MKTKAHVNIGILVAIIVISAFLYIIVMGIGSRTTNMEQYLSSEDFSKVVFKSGTRYPTSPECKALVEQIVKTKPDYANTNEFNYNSVLNMFTNNVYVDKNKPDEFYGVNECIMPNAVAANLGIKNCTIGDFKLQKNNPEHKEISWVVKDGCVMTEKQIKNNLDQIVNGVADHINKNPQKMATQVVKETGNLDKNTVGTITQTKQNMILMDKMQTETDFVVQQQIMAENNSASLSKLEKKLRALKEWYNDRAQLLSSINRLLRNKISGLRYYVYRGYHNENINFFRENIPFETGPLNYIHNYEGIRGFNSPDPITTQSISVEVTGFILPDVSGNWKFELTSDDGAYMWLQPVRNPDAKYDFTNMSNPIINNGGVHGAVNVSATVQMVGIDNPSNAQLYAIRIVQGNNGGWGTFMLHVTKPNGQVTLFDSSIFAYSQPKDGLACKIYKGYFFDNVEWFKTWIPLAATEIGEINHMPRDAWNPNYGLNGKAQYYDFTRLQYTDPQTMEEKSAFPFPVAFYPFEYEWQRSLNIYGWFVPQVAGEYGFFISSDDASYLWIGDSALTWFVQDALINNNGLHGTISKKAVFNVRQDQVKTFIPFRLIQGDWGGGNTLTFAYTLPGQTDAQHNLLELFKH